MERTKTTITYVCDICERECTGPAQPRHHVVGYLPVEPYGVQVSFKVFGVPLSDSVVCGQCASLAMKALVEEENLQQDSPHD